MLVVGVARKGQESGIKKTAAIARNERDEKDMGELCTRERMSK